MPFVITEYNLTLATLEIAVLLFVTFLLGIILGWILQSLSFSKSEKMEDENVEDPLESTKIQRIPVVQKAQKNEKIGDDFTLIYGISDEIESLLNKNKIFTYNDIVETDIEGLEKILGNAAKKFHKISPVTWPDQAKLIDEKSWRELEEYQKILKKSEKNKSS